MHTVNDLANIVDTRAAGGVHFHNIHMATFDNRTAMFTHAAGICRWATLPVRADTIHAFGNNARGCGFTRSADTCHDKCLRNAISGKGIFQGAHHCILTDQIGKGFWSVFPRKNLIALVGGVRHGTSDFRSCLSYAAIVRTSRAMCEVGHERI